MESFLELAKSALAYWPFVVLALLALTSIFTVNQQQVAIITRFGKFVRVAEAGLNVRIPLIESVAGSISLKVHQLDVKIETKTEDNVLVDLGIAVQYAVMPNKVFEAHYRLRDARTQIEAYVADAVRSKAPTLSLDALYENKDEVADAVEAKLKSVMAEYGYAIQRVLIVDITPDEKVADAMNDINAARREQVAAKARADADKIIKVTAAEAEADAMALEGKGIANQREAILKGLALSVKELQAEMPNVSVQEIMAMIMLTRYFDTLRDVAHGSNANTIMLSDSPGAFGDLREQIIASMRAGAPVVAAPPPAASATV